MKHRTFGRSGIQVSEIVFGAGSVGGILIHQDDAMKREAIRRAITGGINWIDTAAQYGNGRSEEALGWLLPEARATPYLSTKFNLDVENLKDNPAQIEERLMASPRPKPSLRRSNASVQGLGRPGARPCDVMRDFVRSLGLPTRLGDLGIGADRIPELARQYEGSGPIATNPRPVRGAYDVAAILKLAL